MPVGSDHCGCWKKIVTLTCSNPVDFTWQWTCSCFAEQTASRGWRIFCHPETLNWCINSPHTGGMTGGGNEMRSARIVFAQVPFGNIFTPNSDLLCVCQKGTGQMDMYSSRHDALFLLFDRHVSWDSVACLNHLTKEKGEGKNGARLPAVASSVLQHGMLGIFWLEICGCPGSLLPFLWKCCMEGRRREGLAPF